MKTVRSGEHVKQRTVRIVPQINSLPGQLPQREQLRYLQRNAAPIATVTASHCA